MCCPDLVKGDITRHFFLHETILDECHDHNQIWNEEYWKSVCWTDTGWCASCTRLAATISKFWWMICRRSLGHVIFVFSQFISYFIDVYIWHDLTCLKVSILFFSIRSIISSISRIIRYFRIYVVNFPLYTDLNTILRFSYRGLDLKSSSRSSNSTRTHVSLRVFYLCVIYFLT